MYRQSKTLKTVLSLLAITLLLVFAMFACVPVEPEYKNPYPIQDGELNEMYKDHTEKDQAVDEAFDSLENLLTHLDTTTVSDTGYYLGADMTINTEDGSAFILRLDANLYTYPYEIKDELGNVIFGDDGLPLVDEEALAHHNDIIRYSDVVLEWIDAASNEMLIGFYFDGINENAVDDGNDLYLNLAGVKKIFEDFGNSVLYQQIIRLITHLNLDTIFASEDENGEGGRFDYIRSVFKEAITTNYKKTINYHEDRNEEDATLYFNDVGLTMVAGDVTDFMQSIFKPFEDKLDPLTNKYLGFLFSTLGVTSFKRIDADMEFVTTPDEGLGKNVLRQLVLDTRGDSLLPVYNPSTGLTVDEMIPFQAHISAEYALRTSDKIVFDKTGYKLYEYGHYEYTGDMYIPMLDLELDVLLRTDINEDDNSTNKVFMNCRDIATDDLIIGMYYTAPSPSDGLKKDGVPLPTDVPLTFLDIQGLQDLYGGVEIEDLGLPKAYKGGFDLAETMKWLFDFIDTYIVIAVDNILYGNRSEAEDSKYAELTSTIMNNVTSTMKSEDDPSSRATIKLKIEIEMIRKILSITSETGVEYTTEQMILLINQQFNIDLESIAAILGISLEELIDTTYFDITYDVDLYSIRIEIFSFAEMTQEQLEANGGKANLIMRMDLYPQHVGEFVRIVFPSFKNFNELKDVMTYSGEMEGRFIFASTEEVDLSKLLGSFMGDASGLNTPFILPEAADIYFRLYYDQYIREQFLDDGTGRWTRATRSAFDLYFYMVSGNVATPIMRVYANDVSFNTADPIEELGYIWLDYICVENMPKFKIREDLFIRSFYEYMGYDFETEDEDIVMGLTDIIQALMEDSWAVFEPDVIRVTTSNQTIKDFFRVDELIGSVSVKVGFRQRVFGIDPLEVEFAMYSVGEFEDLQGESPYSIKLHDTIKVYFEKTDPAGYRHVEERDFFFLYDPNSIAVINGESYYMPCIDNLFMGVTRDYLVFITTELGRQAINKLEKDYYEWEPLNPIPTTVSAHYGDDNLTATYPAEYNLHAVYDRNTGYYTVLNDLGYEIVYDFENDLYVIGLGTQDKYDKALTIINTSVPYYYYTYENDAGLTLTYDLGLHMKGFYVVEHPEYQILYNYDNNYYVVQNATIRSELLASNFFGEGATVFTRTYTNKMGYTFKFNLQNGYYVLKITRPGEEAYRVFYNETQNFYFAPTYAQALELQIMLGENRVGYTDTVRIPSADDATFDWDGGLFTKVDWNSTIFRTFKWTDMDWEDLTLEGGKFVVYVVIGEGMMATYRENVVVKVLNRTVDTDKYVNIETPDGTVRAPVADTISIDPYVYLIYKAYFENAGEYGVTAAEKARGFVEWYFKHYYVTINFTKIYNSEEDTPAAMGYYAWSFDDDSRGNAIYSEYDINNRTKNLDGGVEKFESKYTYVYTVFHRQVIALAVEVLPRALDSVLIPGEEDRNTYTVDALEEPTYTLPIDLIYYFRDADGIEYALNFGNYNYEDASASIFSSLPDEFRGIRQTVSGMTLEVNMGVATDYRARFEGVNFGQLLAGRDALDIIKWSNPVATNVKLEGNVVNGSYRPFGDAVSNESTSFFDLANYFDLYRDWYHRGDYDEGWFFIEEIKIEVNVPDKAIGSRDYTFKTGEYNGEVTEKVQNVQMAEYFNGELTVQPNWGVYYVDPYNHATWTIPSEVYAMFDAPDGNGYVAYVYNVQWEDYDTGEPVAMFNPTQVASYRWVKATIGSGQATIEIKLLVQCMSGYTNTMEFLTANGQKVDLSRYADSNDKQDIDYDGFVTASANSDTNYAYQLTTYNFAVDTYARFQIPEVIKITFADDTVRTYEVEWIHEAPWKQGTSVKSVTTIGGNNAFATDLYVTYDVEAKIVADLTVHNAIDYSELLAGISVIVNTSVSDNRYEIDVTGAILNSKGYIILQNGATLLPNGEVSNAYNFFNWLFESITISFHGADAITVDDTASSANLPIFGTLDTQKIIEALGQGIDIYVGQDDDAHDYTVTVKFAANEENEIESVDGKEGNIITTVNILNVYNDDNTPKYFDGYVLKNELSFTVVRKDGTSTLYSAIIGNVPEVWAVVSPEGEEDYWDDENKTNRMFDVYPYEQLTSISWDRMVKGGDIWLTAMLEDSSRVFVKISVPVREIGNNFHSLDSDKSRFKINYGTIVIDDFYAHAPLSNSLIIDNIPSTIDVFEKDGDIVQSNVQWQIKYPLREQIAPNQWVEKITYKGTNGKVLFAESNVMGQDVELYLQVLPATVVGFIYDNQSAADTCHFASYIDSQGNIAIDFDAYHNYGYFGNFELPTSIKVKYAEEGRYTDLNGDGVNEYYGAYDGKYATEGTVYNVYTLNRVGYQKTNPTGGDAVSIDGAIGYDYNGYIESNNSRQKIYYACATLLGQNVYFRIYFLNKTITGITKGNAPLSEEAVDKFVYEIDPYSEDISVNKTITLHFAEGEGKPFQLTGNLVDWIDAWVLDPNEKNFEVQYDTWDTILSAREDKYFKFTSTIQTKYLGIDMKAPADSTIDPKQIEIHVVIKDRRLETYIFDEAKDADKLGSVGADSDSYFDYDKPLEAGEVAPVPNQYYHYVDVFAARPSDLPKTLSALVAEGITIVWDNFVIPSEGTGYDDNTPKYVIVKGHVYNADRGQPVAIRVYVDGWRFEAIRKPKIGTDDYIIMDKTAISFGISAVTDKSSYDHYMVDFALVKLDPKNGTYDDTQIVSKKFIPADLGGVTNDYRLYWNSQAVARAKNEGESKGAFYFGNDNGQIAFEGLPQATYYYESLNVLQIDMGYGMGTQNNAIYVFNPLNPNFVEGMEVSAMGAYDNLYNVDYATYGLKATISWVGLPSSYTSLLAGGVIRNQTVVIKLTKESDPEFSYTQEFKVLLVALDMSPTSYINNQAGSMLTNAQVKTTYNASTYVGAKNPYKDLYVDSLINSFVEKDGMVANVLDTAVRKEGLAGKFYTYNVIEWEGAVYVNNGVYTQYSKKVEIYGIEYSPVSLVMRRWNAHFRIDSINAGYGDNLYVINPVNPDFGEPYGTDAYVTKLEGSDVSGENDGTALKDTTYKYSVTWWNRALTGEDITFGDELFNGGIIKDWKVIVTVYDNDTVVYDQVVNITLLILDMRPTSGTTFYSESDMNTTIPLPIISDYASDTYANKDNPYGEEYLKVRDALNLGVAAQISTSATYRVSKWGEAKEENGKQVRYSEEVSITYGGQTVVVKSNMFKLETNI